MSRIVVFDNNGLSLGEVQANCTRGWAINDGGEAKIKISAAAALESWMDFGKIVLIEHPRLPAWAGMIDTPWIALPPIEVSLYSAPYLLAIRTPDEPLTFSGTAGEIAMQLVNAANDQDDLLIRAGDMDMDDPDRAETFNQSQIWEQLVTLAKKANMEIQIRPERDMNNKLILYLDMKHQLGYETPLLLKDGIGGNMTVSKAEITSEIWNRITGIGDQSSKLSRMQSAAMLDEESINRWRLRSKVVQFQGTSAQSILDANAQAILNQSSWPVLSLNVNILDEGETFSYLRIGNWLEVHASTVCLPCGVRGWRGKARITAMSYKEETNQVNMLLEGAL